MDVIWLILAGIVGGILGGLGMGGGTLLIPILNIFLSLNQHLSQSINLLCFIPMSIIALIIHCKNKLVNFKIGLPIIITGVAFSVLGSLLANSTNAESLKIYFGVFLIVLGLFQFLSIWFFKLPKKCDEIFVGTTATIQQKEIDKNKFDLTELK